MAAQLWHPRCYWALTARGPRGQLYDPLRRRSPLIQDSVMRQIFSLTNAPARLLTARRRGASSARTGWTSPDLRPRLMQRSMNPADNS